VLVRYRIDQLGLASKDLRLRLKEEVGIEDKRQVLKVELLRRTRCRKGERKGRLKKRKRIENKGCWVSHRGSCKTFSSSALESGFSGSESSGRDQETRVACRPFSSCQFSPNLEHLLLMALPYKQ